MGSQGGRIRLKGTDLLTFASVRLPTAKPKGDFHTLVDFGRLAGFVQLWEGMVELQVKKSHLKFICGRDNLTLTRDSTVKAYLDKFPSMDLPKSYSTVRYMAEQIEDVYRVIRSDHENVALRGIHVELNRVNCMVEAADGLRMMRIDQMVSPQKRRTLFDIVINHNAGRLFTTLPNVGRVWATDNYMHYMAKDTEVAVLRLGVEYPDLSPSLKVKLKAKVEFDPKGLSLALKKCKLIGANRVELESVAHSPNDRLQVYAEAEGGDYEYKGELGCEIKGGMPNIILGIDHLEYILSYHPTGNEQFYLRFGTTYEAVIYRHSGTQYLSMPYTRGSV